MPDGDIDPDPHAGADRGRPRDAALGTVVLGVLPNLVARFGNLRLTGAWLRRRRALANSARLARARWFEADTMTFLVG